MLLVNDWTVLLFRIFVLLFLLCYGDEGAIGLGATYIIDNTTRLEYIIFCFCLVNLLIDAWLVLPFNGRVVATTTIHILL